MLGFCVNSCIVQSFFEEIGGDKEVINKIVVKRVVKVANGFFSKKLLPYVIFNGWNKDAVLQS